MLRLFFIVLFFNFYSLKSASINEGYKALSIYDYFKARKIFYDNLNRKPTESSYGLAIIFFRTDNPFSDIDSSAKYISKAISNFKDTANLSGFIINPNSISSLSNQIAEKGFKKYVDSSDIKKINFFLSHYPFADFDLKEKAYDKRDLIIMNSHFDIKKSEDIQLFLLQYPQSNIKNEAKKIFYKCQYNEQVKKNSIDELKTFILNYAKNPYKDSAELILFEKVKQEYSPEILKDFISCCSSNLTIDEAWKFLYGLEIKNDDKNTLLNFISKYPNYPNSNIIYQEIELTEKKLLPLKNKNDLYGFIDTTGKWVIKPKYDDAQSFSEGYSAVCINDSCFFINKKGEKLVDIYFNEIESFYNGVAVVKNQQLYYLLNRSGQIISEGYEEITTNNNNVYVCKKNGVYGAIDSKARQIIPFIYQKLGDFTNGYSYYQKGKIGLINLKNQTLPDIWDWISEVNSEQLIIVKRNNKFGIINTSGELIIEPKYDLIQECGQSIYLLVDNANYGFYNIKDKCFETYIEYTYKNQLIANEYFNGTYFKLYRNNDVGIIDKNGKLTINYGVYQNITFNENNLLKVQKNNKYGFIDYKQKPIVPIEYEYADNFATQSSIVSKSNSYSIIDHKGKIIYTLKNAVLKRLSPSIILVEQEDEKIGLINPKGEILVPIIYNEYKDDSIDGYLFKLNDNLFYYNSSYKFMIPINSVD